jgi:hypothetical protein
VTIAIDEAALDLYWLPLGAGGHSVRLSGRVFEALAARLGGRRASALYHSALIVRLAHGSNFVIEQAPVPDARSATRGVVGGGAVGARWAGRARIFRYEVRRWRDGVISDVTEAVESPHRLTNDPRVARLLWRLVPDVPSPVWVNDELGAGEMWLQLADLLADRARRPRCSVDPAACRWSGAGLGRRHRDARRTSERIDAEPAPIVGVDSRDALAGASEVLPCPCSTVATTGGERYSER